MKNVKLIIFVSFFLVSCSGLKEAGKVLRNEKIKTTDEFLVEKRDPLVFPPDYEKMPKPETINKKEISEEEKIKKILKAPKAEETTKKKKSSSLEESLLKSIRK